MTQDQKDRFAENLRSVQKKADDFLEFHHGDCIGSDADAHEIACFLEWDIVIHPPEAEQLRAWCAPAKHICDPLPYLDRNKEIVRQTDCLIAAPREREEQLRSGTWSTIRFARMLRKRYMIIYPDGGIAIGNG